MSNIPIRLNIHLTGSEHAQEITVDPVTDSVSLHLGPHVRVFLRDPAVITALETALAEARTLLEQMADGVKA